MSDGEGADWGAEPFDLHGMKSIGLFLGGYSSTTVRRWEKNLGLPLYRLNKNVCARKKEVVSWMNAKAE